MSLEPGKIIGNYTVREKIGAGGMGEVYRATDAKLGRDVAIKTLPRDVAADPDRLARFRREAQLLASLNHANIAAIYGLEDAGDTPVLVLELVEGEDLAARLARGPVAVEEALAVALQIAEGLEEAHEHGIVHRDLKPANLKLTPSGKVKILDFGLAKAFDSSPEAQGDPSFSPTLTAAATRAGVILGTAAYMSPEQARGGTVDKRSDIWAFGCVLLEMLSGSKTFAGDTISDTLASILKSDPDWSALPSSAPPSLRRLLRRCLQKDRRRRLRDIGEARLALEEMLSGGSEEDRAAAAMPASAAAGRPLLPMLIAVAITAAVTAGALFLLRPAPTIRGVQKYQFSWPGNLLDESHAPLLSPDGNRILFATPAGLWIRSIDDLDARLLAGTERASHPFWSPDGASVGFSKEGALWKTAVEGGQAASIAVGAGELGTSGRISWAEDGRIVFSDGNYGISEVSSRGGDASVILEPDVQEVGDIHDPVALPGGRGILYVAHRLMTTFDTLRVYADGKSKTILQLDNQELRTPIYTTTGHILYRRDTGNVGLWAVPFDLAGLETTGEPFLVAREGSLPSSASDGSLLYAWRARQAQRQMVWLDRQGTEIGTVGPVMANQQAPALSPDGRQVAVMAQENELWDIWILDVARETRSRLTFSPAKDWDPVWTPDSRQVIFWDGTLRAISMKPADGTGDVVRLVQEEFPDSGIPTPSPDGTQLLFWVRGSASNGDLYRMPMEGERKAVEFLKTPHFEDQPALSPDGEYAAYVSDESGRREVYLTRFPTAGGRWQVSVKGGNNPRWNASGDRLHYLQGIDLMEVEVILQPAVRVETPHRLFSITWLEPDQWWSNGYSVDGDGERFLFVKVIEPEGAPPSLVLVRNWIREFDRTD